VTGGWVPGAVLVAGLALAAVIVARAPDVSVSTLRQIHGDGTMLHEVGGVYVAGWVSPDWNPFVEDRFRILTLLAAVVYLSSVTAIGATLVGAIRGAEHWPRTVRVLAGFLPGYLIVLVPLQLLFAAVYYVTAAWITLAVLPVVAVLLHRRPLQAGVADLRGDPGRRRQLLGTAAIVVGILVLCGVYRLQAGRNFMVPDSITAFLNAAGEQLRGAYGTHLAQWDQQSDEWLFSAPLMFTSTQSQDYLFAFYAAGFVALASFSALVFGIVHSVAVRRPRISATLAMGAVLASSATIYPWEQVSLIGGQNPAMWLELPGRLVGIVGPWIALLLIGRLSRRTAVAILLATAGLAFTTISSTAYIGVALACAGSWHLLRGRGPAQLRGLLRTWVVPVLGVVAVLTPAFVFWDLHRLSPPHSLGWVLLAGSAAAIGAAMLLALSASDASPIPSITRVAPLIGVLLAALGAGFLLSNNLVGDLAGGQVRETLASVLPGYEGALQSRSIITSPVAFPTFTGQECQFTGHCVSFPYFLAAYGFLTILALATWLALSMRDTGVDPGPRRAAFLVTVAALVASFALVDFTGADQLTAWILTRFTEVPYYALLGFAAVAFVGSRNRVTAWAGGGVLVIWTAVPLAVSHVFPQLAHNAKYFLDVLN
jgi:hypothetical protein